MDENTKDQNIKEILVQFTQVAMAFNMLADRVEKEGHPEWIEEALNGQGPKVSQADKETNIIPAEAWKETCDRLELPFEYIPRGNLNG